LCPKRATKAKPLKKIPWHGVARLVFVTGLASPSIFSAVPAPPSFEVSVTSGLIPQPQPGRLFVILSQTNNPEPRLTLGRSGPDAPPALAKDVERLRVGSKILLDQTAFAFPITNLLALPAGDYFAQALFDCNIDLRSTKAPGNLYSTTQRIHLPPTNSEPFKIELNQQIPPEQLPADTDQIKDLVSTQARCRR
jgi:hypothetical protein